MTVYHGFVAVERIPQTLDFFCRSEVYRLMRDGVSDMHCMSDEYHADELKIEYQKKRQRTKKS